MRRLNNNDLFVRMQESEFDMQFDNTEYSKMNVERLIERLELQDTWDLATDTKFSSQIVRPSQGALDIDELDSRI